jgi:hypothetical protein
MISRFIQISMLGLALFPAHMQGKVAGIMAVEFPGAMQPPVAPALDGGIDLVFGQGDAIYFTHSPVATVVPNGPVTVAAVFASFEIRTSIPNGRGRLFSQCALPAFHRELTAGDSRPYHRVLPLVRRSRMRQPFLS